MLDTAELLETTHALIALQRVTSTARPGQPGDSGSRESEASRKRVRRLSPIHPAASGWSEVDRDQRLEARAGPFRGPCDRREARADPLRGPCDRLEARIGAFRGPFYRLEARIGAFRGPFYRLEARTGPFRGGEQPRLGRRIAPVPGDLSIPRGCRPSPPEIPRDVEGASTPLPVTVRPAVDRSAPPRVREAIPAENRRLAR